MLNLTSLKEHPHITYTLDDEDPKMLERWNPFVVNAKSMLAAAAFLSTGSLCHLATGDLDIAPSKPNECWWT